MLTIPQNIVREIISHGCSEAPIEACGILAGTCGRVEKFYKMTNADSSSDHFTMLPAEQFGVIKNIRATGMKMLAIYHTHPETPARPSQEDIKLALTPDVVYIIVSLADAEKPDVQGFLIEDGKVEKIKLELAV